MNPTATRTTIAALALAVPLTATGCEGRIGLSAPATGDVPTSAAVERARRHLAGLDTAPQGDGSGYDRDQFGTRWKDTDRNGCDQRNDVLARDLDDVTKRRGGCIVLSGRLRDPYTGKTLAFTKKKATVVQIDHIYPLALAWRMGASRWSADKRERFANDLDNLLAVWGVPNRQKSDSGPGEWEPRTGYRCTYAIKYVAVADDYALPVTRADHRALRRFLNHC